MIIYLTHIKFGWLNFRLQEQVANFGKNFPLVIMTRYTVLYQIRYSSKRMRQFVKFEHRFLIRNRATLLWCVREAAGYGITALFCQTRRNSANAPHFHGKRCCNPAKGKDCGTLQDGTLRRGHQIAALLVGE